MKLQKQFEQQSPRYVSAVYFKMYHSTVGNYWNGEQKKLTILQKWLVFTGLIKLSTIKPMDIPTSYLFFKFHKSFRNHLSKKVLQVLKWRPSKHFSTSKRKSNSRNSNLSMTFREILRYCSSLSTVSPGKQQVSS